MNTTTTEAPVVEANCGVELCSRFPDIDLEDGEVYAGLSRDHESGAWHHLVLLPAVTDKDLTWQGALDWAMIVAGGNLPTRFESALLYANAREHIDQDHWYWTATPYAGDERYAWVQYFGDGFQYYDRKVNHDRARAVRRVPV